MAAMGRMDPAVLSVRCARCAEKSMVLMRLSAGRRRNVQGATVIRSAVFCSLAIVAKKVGPRALCNRRTYCNDRADCVAMDSTHDASVDCACCCHRSYLVIASAAQNPLSRRVDQRDHRMRCICDWRFHWRKLRVAESWLFVWQRALPLPCHQFVLQPCIASLEARLVIEGSILVDSFGIPGFSSHAAMDAAASLSWRTYGMRVRGRATGSRSRPSRPDCNDRSVAADVCAAGPDA